MHLAVALDGAGSDPAAWREPGARPDELLTARYWVDLVREAEAGKLDFVTFEDSLGPGSDDTGHVRGRLDAVLIASRVAPLTAHIGLVPTAVATHTEPFHLSKAIATLDYVSNGRAGVHIVVSDDERDYRHFGRREFPSPGLRDEAADYVEVLRRLWDSWEDDAEIRDVATGRFVDRDKLHYIDFEGKWFTVKGPSITPRPPQGQPVVAGDDLVFADPDAPVGHGRTFADVPVRFPDDGLADRLVALRAKGFFGARLIPARLPHDLTGIVTDLVPELQRRGVFRHEYEATTLRGLLGLARPGNRYATGAA
ncbi:LLM class flavin-dependent oxidoreductase [Kibdelosporangium phytohabitans]|uniref:FMNH2-dependent monooxygenase n=1 Tax=Kibdelosporangium phytohabitans TaxID=860235 RepID=A0A0N7F4F2_9PSEU|nr:LLM class flavin-dependent oxidoreductase [Kibdelosporangium phytohabitans]ALG11263.1 FMNH2-dependent monooxygenase [Kibdelosporangium phytohabitans]MBE1462551.1 alkanesulfonate monooxygenase SsuD/methylene tetrahydromethanopterin reductase-like flavin-dependent oxidoreductase (luciferase family) [Kibdelosporangium phytohabitans]